MSQHYPMYNEALEHESCGVGAIVDLSGRATHRTVVDALTIVERLAHRAGRDAAGTTGDGVGIMTQLPHALFSRWAQANHLSIGERGDYGVGMFFLPQSQAKARTSMRAFEECCAVCGIPVIAWREPPCRPKLLGQGALRTLPIIRQCFLKRPQGVSVGAAFDRALYLLRRDFERQRTDTYICSLSSRTIVYKGMMLVDQLRPFYQDLSNPEYASALAMVHSRFSTNTHPSWSKAHPHRMLMHNGEINTIRGNADRMLAREETMRLGALGDALSRAYPVILSGGSDSQMLDNTLEFLNMNGLSLPLCGMVLLPEPWQGQSRKTPWRDLYRYYAAMMEPWDGPAAVLYTDGERLCASLDRNGLRPMRCARTRDGRLILSSEAGVLHEVDGDIERRWRLRAGDILMADLTDGSVTEGDALKARLAAQYPYAQWVREGYLRLEALPPSREAVALPSGETLNRLSLAFGYAWEDIRDSLLPMARDGGEPIGSMGADEPIAALSRVHPSLFSYFKQRFAQVTNPPIDALRERIKTDCAVLVGDDGNLLHPAAENCRVLELPSPILTREELSRIRSLHQTGFKVGEISLLYDREAGMQCALNALFERADALHSNGVNIIILTDRALSQSRPALPSLLAVSALEQHLVRTKQRTGVSVILESGEPRDSHQAALLIAYGARAIQPWLAHAHIANLCASGEIDKPAERAIADYDKALTDGVLHIASKMGVSTLQAYQSAQLFECVGLNEDLVEAYFTNTPRHLSGISLASIERDTLWHFDRAWHNADAALDSLGRHKLRTGEMAEEHLYSPEIIHALQQAVWNDDFAQFANYSRLVSQNGPRTLRGLMRIAYEKRSPIPIEEVEPAERIVRRFKTGAMSYGSLSREAHECLARAMNAIGGKSNTGEGGELPERFGTELNSAIKQVASGRFGVTLPYLRSADEIQIKMSQGAKPGEGGHLPGTKVSPQVARTRCSTPGISLISPPPHHDIYSIEDLAQLIYDLKCANPQARVNVKLVAQSGVGTVACGVAKAGAQVILISGGEGGTGAAPLTSIHGAGLPWELGLAEAHQTLCKNGLRSMVRLETDGKLMTGRDVAIAMLLGAEEFSFATAPLVAMGCRMMRVCNLDTCPFGIATQNPELRRRFKGQPEYVIRFMRMVAEELREILAKLGARSVDELVGRGDLLEQSTESPLCLDELIGLNLHCRFDPTALYDFKLESRLDQSDLAIDRRLYNTDRSFGTLLGSRLFERYGEHIPHCRLHLEGCGGQSFGAFLPKGVCLTLAGEANDYLGKGLSGGTIAVCPPNHTQWSEGDALIGNVALFGATGGLCCVAGTAGERFCVRNSGATAVVEGVGDHGCEYMTGGRAVILGPIGDNFAAGMSGGIAYVLDDAQNIDSRVNRDMVEIHAVSTARERDELRRLLEAHVQLTQSARAAALLERFEESVQRFKMILPVEYKRLLQEVSTWESPLDI